MEIPRNSSKVVYLDIYGGGADATPTAVCKVNGEGFPLFVDSETPPAGSDIDQRFFVTVGMQHTQNDGTIQVEWTFEVDAVPVTKRDYFEVFTPYLTLAEVKDIYEDASTSEAQAAEAAVRHIINAHTGQDFGSFVGTKKVRGSGSSALQLPVRLITLDNVNANGYFSLADDGWTLRQVQWGVPSVKADYYGLHMHRNGVIHNPNMVKLGEFLEPFEYEVTGTWGWEFVPQAVKEAAKLLIADYADPDSEYRDRYLTSMTAADWRIQFHSGAFQKTGNVRADQLLNQYVLKSGWAVV